MRKSEHIGSSMPAPRAKPWIAAIRTLSSESMKPQRSRSRRPRRASTYEGAVPNSLMSAPAEKARSPAPLKMTTRTSGSSRTACMRSQRSSRICTLMALRTSGRLRVIQARPSEVFSWRRVWVICVKCPGAGKAGAATPLLSPVGLHDGALLLRFERTVDVRVDPGGQFLHRVRACLHALAAPAAEGRAVGFAQARLIGQTVDDQDEQLAGFLSLQFQP